jgi:hypothetical protein
MNIISRLNHWHQNSRAIAPALKHLRHQSILAVTIGLIAVGLSACSFSVGGLDMNELKKQITTGVETQTGVELEEIDCPKNRDVEQGDTFACTATTTDGRVITLRVTQTDDQGNVNWEVVDTASSETTNASAPDSTQNNDPK